MAGYTPLMRFAAHVITGAGRGKRIGTPTLNVHLEDVPKELAEGIYACRVQWFAPLHVWFVRLTMTCKWQDAVLHYGPRPVFKDSLSCEVHVLDEIIQEAPEKVEVEIVQYLRPVLDFPSPEALQKQIKEDIEEAREALKI